MDAFRRAADQGFGIETDLRTDRDGTIVLFHDRLVKGEPVDTLELQEIKRRSDRSVPTLDDLLHADLNVPLNLEVKTMAAWSALEPYIRAGLPDGVLVSSFVHRIAMEAAGHGLDAALLIASAPLSGGLLPSPAERLSTLVWDFNVIDRALLDSAAERGFRNVVYGAITAEEHDILIGFGCDVITDTPDVARDRRAWNRID